MSRPKSKVCTYALVYRYSCIYVQVFHHLCVYIYIYIVCAIKMLTQCTSSAACPACPSHFVKNYTFPLGASSRSRPPSNLHTKCQPQGDLLTLTLLSHCGQGSAKKKKTKLHGCQRARSLNNQYISFFRYKFYALFCELLLLFLLLLFFFFLFVCCWFCAKFSLCAGGMKKLHVPALSANGSGLCIVTHKIMHIEFSIIAMVIATALELPAEGRREGRGEEKLSIIFYC